MRVVSYRRAIASRVAFGEILASKLAPLSMLKKGTGTSPPSAVVEKNVLLLGASPLFQRPAIPDGKIMADIRLYMLQTGTLRCKLHNIKMNQGLGEPYEIPVPWFLITHPKGNVVIDGGNAVECATDPIGHWGDITNVYWPVMTEQEGCLSQLRRIEHRARKRALRAAIASAPRPHRRGRPISRAPRTSCNGVNINMPSHPTGLPRGDTSARILTGPA